MRLPPKLQPGDTVGIIAPSGSFERERLASGLAFLRAKGFDVREGMSLYAQNRYLAGTDSGACRRCECDVCRWGCEGYFCRAWRVWVNSHFGAFGLGVCCPKPKGAGWV